MSATLEVNGYPVNKERKQWFVHNITQNIHFLTLVSSTNKWLLLLHFAKLNVWKRWNWSAEQLPKTLASGNCLHLLITWSQVTQPWHDRRNPFYSVIIAKLRSAYRTEAQWNRDRVSKLYTTLSMHWEYAHFQRRITYRDGHKNKSMRYCGLLITTDSVCLY